MCFIAMNFLSLRTEDINFARGLVSVRAGYANNVEGRLVPTSETLLDVLRRLVKEAEEGGSSIFKKVPRIFTTPPLYPPFGYKKSHVTSATWRDG